MMTAMRMMMPFTTSCQNELTLMSTNPLLIIPMTIAPKNVPLIRPMPPLSEAPPNTHAAIASSS